MATFRNNNSSPPNRTCHKPQTTQCTARILNLVMIPILVIVPSNTKIVVVTPIPGGFGISPVLTVGEVCNWPANKPGPAFEAAVAGGVAEMYAYVQKRLDAARE